MVIQKKTMTTPEFLAFANLPENADKLLELIEGEIVEKVASFTPSEIGSTVNYYIKGYLIQHPIGYVTGEAGSYVMDDDNTFMPDVGYISKARLPERPPRECPLPPDFAVEVKSPSDAKRALRRKAEKYLELGTKMVWLVFPDEQQVEVYLPDEDVKTFTLADTLDGGDLLPAFTLAVKDIFPQ
jgi:Uma2 family endonuclease